MITLYTHPASLNGAKVHLLLEEAGKPYELKIVDLPKREHLEPEGLERNSFGLLPYIDDDGFFLGESNTAMRYIAQKYSLVEWYPEELKARANVEKWMDFSNFHINVHVSFIFVARWFSRNFEGWGMNLAQANVGLGNLARYLPLLEQRLVSSDYVDGFRPTLGDLCLIPFLAVAPGLGVPFDKYTGINRWRERMLARDSWKKIAYPRWPVP